MIELRDRCKINSAHILSSEDKGGEGGVGRQYEKSGVFAKNCLQRPQNEHYFLKSDKF